MTLAGRGDPVPPIPCSAAQPGVPPVCSREESQLAAHLRVVDAPAGLVMLPLALSAWLLEVALASDRLDESVHSQHPAGMGEGTGDTL